MVCLKCGGSRHYNKVNACQILLVQAEALSNDPFEPVSIIGLADVFFRYRQSQPRVIHLVYPGKHGKLAVRGFCGPVKNALKIRAGGQAARSREPELCG
jgi:hypothetical protein